MITRRVYFFLRYTIIFIISFAIAVVVIATYSETLQYLGVKFIKENKIEYSKIDGSLLKGITLHDVNYADAVFIKTLQINYNLLMLFSPTPIIKKIKADELSVIFEKLPSNEEDSSELFIIPFSLSKLQLNKAQIIFNDEMFAFDAQASKIDFDTKLNVKNLAIKLATSYGDAKIEGKIKSNRLYAKSSITPDASISKKYFDFLDGFADILVVDIDATLQKAVMHTNFDKLSLKTEQNLSLHDVDMNLSYFIQENYFSLDSSYSLSYKEFVSEVKQKAIFTTLGDYSSELSATLTKQPFPLPFKSVFAEVSGDTKKMKGNLNAGTLEFDFNSKDYKQYFIQAKSRGVALSFMPELPELFKKALISFKSDSILHVSPFSLKGTIEAEELNAALKGSFEINEKNKLYLASLHPKPDSKLFKAHYMKLLSPFKLVYHDSKDRSVLNLDANMLNLTLFKKEAAVNGWGNFGSANFTTDVTVAHGEEKKIKIFANIASVNKLLSELELKPQDEKLFFDGAADIDATLYLSEETKLKSRINLPWFIIKPDMRTTYLGKNLFLKSLATEKEITIDEYDFYIGKHNIYSKKPSKISLGNNGVIDFKEFWIYDNLLLTGLINPLQMQGNLQAKSDRFVYDSVEGNVTAKTDVKVDFNSNGTQNIEGSITLINGTITYEPTMDHAISDDIIIIGDIKPVKKINRFVNIHVSALNPIAYKTKNIDIHVVPDIVIWQQPDTPLELYGMLSIEDGVVSGGGKIFEFDKSEIYFNGSNPINPYLNLNLHNYTFSDIDIEIFVSNTLSSPIIILSSRPAMSQNDIMSYILFGQSATSTFGKSERSSGSAVGSLLLATGLKEIFNDTVGVSIDTLNILTSEEGTLGYEIGAHFSRDIRMLYKNDTISSIILQYSLSKSIRIDVDVHETGQGINILYIKDF